MEVKIQTNPSLDENWAGRGTEGNVNRRLTSGSFPVEKGNDFVTSFGTLDREEMSELSGISTKNPVVGGSPTSITMMHGVTEKAATSYSFSERVKNTLGIFYLLSMGRGTDVEGNP